MFIVGIVVAFCLLAVGYLVYTVEKIESESVSNQNITGLILYTTNKENSEEVEDILKDIESALSENIKVKVLGYLESFEDVEEVLKEDAKDSVNYNLIEFNKSDLIKEKDTITVKIPTSSSVNHKDSLLKAEKIKEKSKDLNVNIIESRNTPKILNTYIGIEISDIESTVEAKKILDQLVLINE